MNSHAFTDFCFSWISRRRTKDEIMYAEVQHLPRLALGAGMGQTDGRTGIRTDGRVTKRVGELQLEIYYTVNIQ